MGIGALRADRLARVGLGAGEMRLTVGEVGDKGVETILQGRQSGLFAADLGEIAGPPRAFAGERLLGAAHGERRLGADMVAIGGRFARPSASSIRRGGASAAARAPTRPAPG
ncbi:MAG: hypothetical protein HZY79_08620 [Rhodoblastus sp.]|nr:MAG: hypothetical protein HZY79_08620 [Rhodoblastus sp.]